jgi:uncharacterized lipoprotein
MTTFKSVLSLILVIMLSACSTTQHYSYDETYIDKKPLTNDTELLISLLKRPTPADQILMEQFAQTRAQYFDLPAVSYVMIKGERTENTTQQQERPTHHLDALYQAYNTQFITLTGPNSL